MLNLLGRPKKLALLMFLEVSSVLWNIKNGSLKFPDTEMDYIRFGSGEKLLVMLPGLGDGLRTVKGTAPTMALLYLYADYGHGLYEEAKDYNRRVLDFLGQESCSE